MIGQVSVAHATAVVGYDLFKDTIWQQAPYPRILSGVGCAGSAAALDAKISIYVGTVKVGEFYNSAAGAVLVNQHMFAMNENVAAGDLIHAYVDVAPGTHPINVVVELLE